MTIVRAPRGVLTLAFFLLALCILVLVLGPRKISLALIIAPTAGLAVGLMLLRPWAWWLVVSLAPFIALIGLVGVLSATGIDIEDSRNSFGSSLFDVVEYLAELSFGLAAFVYFLSSRVQAAFSGGLGQAEGPPAFSLGCFVILGLLVAAPIVFVLLAFISCATGGECM